MSTHHFYRETTVPAPLEQVFEFFSRAENLSDLTPPWLQFQITSPLPVEMKPGALIEYRLKLMGIPFRWQTLITEWEPGVRFVDAQLKGPYKLWRHEHRFSASGDNTLMVDELSYEAPGWILEPLVTAVFVRWQVERIFGFRAAAIKGIFKER